MGDILQSKPSYTDPPHQVFLFIGVRTEGSSIHKLFPAWAQALGAPSAVVEGVDVALDAPPSEFRRVVSRIKDDATVVGALVTSHKLAVFSAARDLIDELDPLAEALREVSCLSKRGARLFGHAKDPTAMQVALTEMFSTRPGGPWMNATAGLLCLGGGGAGTALLATVVRGVGIRDGVDGCPSIPAKVVIVERDSDRLEALRSALGRLDQQLGLGERKGSSVKLVHESDPTVMVSSMPQGSLIVNATGMGKDTPGSPISDATRFPLDSVVWELNYRGDRPFLRTALQQQEALKSHPAPAGEGGLVVHDGWRLFIHGWCQVMCQVFAVQMSDEIVSRFADAAQTLRST